MEFKKIKKCIEEIQNEKLTKELKQIKQIKKHIETVWGDEVYEMSNGEKYRTNRKLTENQKNKDIKKQIELLTNKEIKKSNKELSKKLEYITELEETEEAQKIDICINWSRGSVYGWQACANMSIETLKEFKHYEGRRTGGCGYDKRSTASAEVLNASKNIFVLIAEKLEKLPRKQIKEYLTRKVDGRDFIGYGFDFWGGCGVGSFSGGVGFECHRRNLEKLGFKCITAHEGKNEDFYFFEKSKRTGR